MTVLHVEPISEAAAGPFGWMLGKPLPTAKEAGLDGYVVSTWYAMWAPKGTPKPVVDRMIKEVQTAMATPELTEIWKNNGSAVPNVTAAAFGTFLNSEIKRWGEVAKASGARID